jgi:hypothetical protein
MWRSEVASFMATGLSFDDAWIAADGTILSSVVEGSPK